MSDHTRTYLLIPVVDSICVKLLIFPAEKKNVHTRDEPFETKKSPKFPTF